MSGRPNGRNVLNKVTTNANEIVRNAMKVRGYTTVMLAKDVGYSGQNAISMALDGRDMRIGTLASLLDALGFDIIIKDRNGNNRENCWKVEKAVRDDGAGTGNSDDERR